MSYTSPAISLIDTNLPFEFQNITMYNLYKETRKTKSNSGIFGDNKNIHIDEIKEWFSEEERFDMISDWALDKVKDAEIIFLEGYSFNSTGKIFQIAENCGVFKNKLYSICDKLTVSVSPGMQKKAFVGKGNAKKTQSVDKFVEFLGVDLSEIIGLPNKYSKPIDDIVDSVSVLYYGYIETNKKKNAKTK